MRSFHLSIFLCCVGGLLCSSLVSKAATYAEMDTTYNSHDLIGNAEKLSYVSTDATALTTLNGTIGSSSGELGEGDVYEIYISNPSAFSASTPVGTPNANGFNTQLFLFNVNGTGIEANDDAVGGIGGASALTSLSSSYSAGYYYLVITGESLNPAGGTSASAIFPNNGTRVVAAPTNASTVFSGYTDNSNEFGQYSIKLTGVQISPAPEPSSLLLIVVGAGVAGFLFRRQRRSGTGAVLVAALCLMAASSRAAAPADAEAPRRAQVLAADGIPKNLGLGLGDLVRDHQSSEKETQARAATGQPQTEEETRSKRSRLLKKYSNIQLDAQNRVLIDVYLDGTKPLKKVVRKLTKNDVQVIAQLETYRKGVLSAWMPISEGVKVGTLPGVRAVQMALRPYYRAQHNIGQVTSQGQTVLHADLVLDMGYDGTGIKVGALSDNFNLYPGQAPNTLPGTDNAAYDVLEGDLPVVQDVLDLTTGVPTDEGRGMLQIVHDVAPGAALAFASAEGTQVGFADAITVLGSPTSVTGLPLVNAQKATVSMVPGVGCQIVCDDVSYLDEPMFSDGIVAQAIDSIATLYNVSYFSSAGNDGNSGYSADYLNAVTASRNLAAVKALAVAQGVNLDQTASAITPSLYAGGIQTFGTDANGNPIVVQNVTVGSIAANLVFQWDDPYDQTLANTVGTGTDPIGVTTDYNILVFDVNGNYLPNMSGTGDNFSTNEPSEIPSTTLTASTSYKIMITRAVDTDDPAGANAANPPVATHLRYVAASDGGGFSGDFINLDSVETYGHNCAANCSGVAAYVYDAIPNINNDPTHIASPQVESFSSNGPVDIYFDTNGVRLATPNHRLQPAFATVDGVDTSFFPGTPTTVILPVSPLGPVSPIVPITPPTLPTLPIDVPITITTVNPNDYDGNGYSNFFGTSAAAPHAAACAALIMQAASANGLAVPTTKYIRSLLQATTQPTERNPVTGVYTPGTDTMPDFCAATGSDTSGAGYSVTLAGSGDVSTDPNTFKITYTGPTGGTYQLSAMLINLTNSELVFDDSSAAHGYPFTQGNATTTGAGGANGATLNTATANLTPDYSPTATLAFTGFALNDVVTFGVDRDVAGIDAYGNGVDQLEGSTFTATLTSLGKPNLTVTGTFANGFSTKL